MDDYDKTLLIGANVLLIINIIGLITIAIFRPQVYCSTKIIFVGFIFLCSISLYLDLRDCVKKGMADPVKLGLGIPIACMGSIVFYLMVLVGKMTFPSI
ncbi:MAG: hypothetical protein WC071_08575 [Victivallaceae bacterium]